MTYNRSREKEFNRLKLIYWIFSILRFSTIFFLSLCCLLLVWMLGEKRLQNCEILCLNDIRKIETVDHFNILYYLWKYAYSLLLHLRAIFSHSKSVPSSYYRIQYVNILMYPKEHYEFRSIVPKYVWEPLHQCLALKLSLGSMLKECFQIYH